MTSMNVKEDGTEGVWKIHDVLTLKVLSTVENAIKDSLEIKLMDVHLDQVFVQMDLFVTKMLNVFVLLGLITSFAKYEKNKLTEDWIARLCAFIFFSVKSDGQGMESYVVLTEIWMDGQIMI